MRKNFTLIAISLLFAAQGWNQVKIGGTQTPPDPSAVLELDGGISRGLLMPRMTQAAINALANPAEGLMIYSTTDGAIYLRVNSKWVVLANTSNTSTAFSLPFDTAITLPNQPVFKIMNTGNSGTAIFGKAAVGNNGAAGVQGDATLKGSYGIKGTGFDGTGGYFNSRNKYALVTDTGRVGFGTLAPKALVEINGSKASGVTLLLDDDVNLIKMQQGSIDKGFIDVNNNNIRIGTLVTNTTGRFVVRTGGGDRLFVDSAGGVSVVNRLGVGLPQAEAKLHISAINSSLPAVIVDDEDATIQLRSNGIDKGVLQTFGDNLRIGTNFENTNGKLVLRSGGLDRAFLNFGGSFSIGTETADARLYVSSANSTQPAISVDDPVASTFQLRTNGVDKGFVQTTGDDVKIGTNFENSNGKVVIRTGGVDRVFVDVNGNVSIGSNLVAAGYKVSIDGKVIAEEMRIQNSAAWADYVFDPAYKLMPLKDVKNFIVENRHLPDVPEGKEIEDNGIPVGEMQTLMMQKIEELTLYLIKANEQIENLQKEIEALKKK